MRSNHVIGVGVVAAMLLSGLSVVWAEKPATTTTAPATKPATTRPVPAPGVAAIRYRVGPGQAGSRLNIITHDGDPDKVVVGQAPQVETVKLPYMGVSAVAIDAALQKHLGLPEGVGLLVDYVDSGSPAKDVGIQMHDVLWRLNDQILVNAQQLGVLVRMHRPGEELRITLLRQAKPVDVTVRLAEREFQKMLPLPGQPRGLPTPAEGQLARTPGAPPIWIPAGAQLQVLPTQVALPPLASGAQTKPATTTSAPATRPAVGQAMQLRIGGGMAVAGNVVVMADGRGGGNVMVANAGAGAGLASMSMSDGTHALTITMSNGQKTLLAKDKEGTILFQGPIDTPEQRQLVPADVLKKVEKLEGNTRVRIEVSQPQ